MEQKDIRGLIGHRLQCGKKIVLGSPLIAIRIAHDTADATDVQVAQHPQPPRHPGGWCCLEAPRGTPSDRGSPERRSDGDRKSTRLNSSHVRISYAVFCLKKK